MPVIGAESFPQEPYEIKVDLHRDMTKDVGGKLSTKFRLVKKQVGWRAH